LDGTFCTKIALTTEFIITALAIRCERN